MLGTPELLAVLCAQVTELESAPRLESSPGTLAQFSKPARLHANTCGAKAQRFRSYSARSSS